jgi:hypothetical protein
LNFGAAAVYPCVLRCRRTALTDGGFLRQISKILADLKVVWQAKNISGGLSISGGFLADLTNSAQAFFSGGFVCSLH